MATVWHWKASGPPIPCLTKSDRRPRQWCQLALLSLGRPSQSLMAVQMARRFHSPNRALRIAFQFRWFPQVATHSRALFLAVGQRYPESVHLIRRAPALSHGLWGPGNCHVIELPGLLIGATAPLPSSFTEKRIILNKRRSLPPCSHSPLLHGPPESGCPRRHTPRAMPVTTPLRPPLPPATINSCQ